MRPGEYCTTNPGHPFCRNDVTFHQGDTPLGIRSTEAELLQATHVTLTFREQKNANRGEKVSQARTNNVLCPVTALARREIHLRRAHAPPDAPIHSVYAPHPTHITSKNITDLLRQGARAIGLEPHEVSAISAASLRATGASALLTAGVDSDLIRLLGRWKSDAMLRYLHTQSVGLLHNTASRMLLAGASDLPATRRAPVTT
jgi:hypothetical protein